MGNLTGRRRCRQLPSRTGVVNASNYPPKRVKSIERAQGPAPVALDEEPDNGFPAAPGIANRDQAAVRRRLVGVDPDVVSHPHARSHGVLRDENDECLAAEHRPPGSPPRRRERARGSRNGVWDGRHTSAPALPVHPGAQLDAGPGPGPALGSSRHPISEPDPELEPHVVLGVVVAAWRRVASRLTSKPGSPGTAEVRR